jgi:uncharacterized protein YbjT (DUF2867 family)
MANVTPDAAEAHGAVNAERVILVTGSTGTQGGAVARELIARGYTVRGLTRDPGSETARALAELGATMVRGDYDDPASLAAAMEGVHGVFAVTLFWHSDYQTEVEQGRRLIDEAEKSGVGHFVLTSVAGADQDTGIPHFDSKWEVEKYLHTSDLDWTVVRPVEFMDNWGWSLEDFRNGRLIDPRAPESSHQWIAARDIGYLVGEAFDDPRAWVGRTEEIAGDELTIAELRATLSEAFGREFEHIRPGWAEFEAQAGEEIALMYRWFEDEGYDVDVDALKQRYPNLQTAAGFLSDMARTAGN